MRTLAERLTAIADRLTPCPPPDVFHGEDLCPCRYGSSYPCPTTEAAWLAHGLDPITETHRAINAIRPTEHDLTRGWCTPGGETA